MISSGGLAETWSETRYRLAGSWPFSMALRIFMVRHTKSQLKPYRLMKALCMLVLVWSSVCSILCWLFFFQCWHSSFSPVVFRRFCQRRHGCLPWLSRIAGSHHVPSVAGVLVSLYAGQYLRNQLPFPVQLQLGDAQDTGRSHFLSLDFT